MSTRERLARSARTISEHGVTSAGQRPGRIHVGSTSYVPRSTAPMIARARSRVHTQRAPPTRDTARAHFLSLTHTRARRPTQPGRSPLAVRLAHDAHGLSTPAARGGHLPGGRVAEAVRIDVRAIVARRGSKAVAEGGGSWLTWGCCCKASHALCANLTGHSAAATFQGGRGAGRSQGDA